MKNKLSLLIVMAIIISQIASCGNDKQSSTTDDIAATETETNTDNKAEDPFTLLIQNMDFNGEVISILDQPCETSDLFIFNQQEESGDILNDTIYHRNLAVQEALNVTFDITTEKYAGSDSNQTTAADKLNKMIMANDTTYDFCFGIQFNVAPMVLNNSLLELTNAKPIDFSQPWWAGDYINEASINGKVYLATGDITLGLIRTMGCVYTNSRIFTDNFGNKQDLYDMVLDGKWTIDAMSEYVKQIWSDLNGDSTADISDLYGLITNDVSSTDHFVYDAGFRSTSNADGKISFAIDTERNNSIVDKLTDLFYNNQGTLVVAWNQTNPSRLDKFVNGEALLFPAFIGTAESLREMKDDFMVIPYPKYDENDSYTTLAHDTSNVVIVPVTCTKTDAVFAVMEALAIKGYEEVLPTYYETSLKVKYVRDGSDDATNIIDLIHDSSFTNFGFIYNYALGGAGLITREVLGGSRKALSTYYASMKTSYNEKLAALLK